MIQRRRLSKSTSATNPVLAVLTTAALAITAVFGGNYVMKTQSIGGADTEVVNMTESLAEGESVVVDDPAVPTQGEDPETQRTVKEFTSDVPFSMFALTWEGETDTAAFVRAERENGEWSEWYDLDHMYEVEGSTKNGTELIYIEPTKRVQVNMTNVDIVGTEETTEETSEEPAEEPTLTTNHGEIQPVADSAGVANQADDFEVVMIDGGTGMNQDIAPASYDGMPKVVSRAGWGARTDLQRNPTIVSPVKTVTVHHTAGSNNYSEAQAPGIVRGIQDYHGATLGWGDVGYNALVDKYGNIYEGRYGGLDRDVMGAHVGGFNYNTWGISVLGNYETEDPSQAALQAVGQMAGWRLAQENQDPTGRSWLTMSGSFRGSKYANGQGAMFPNINAHRDFHHNQCPGTHLYSQMGTIRNIAKQRYDSIMNGTAETPATSTPTTPTTPSTPDSGNDSTTTGGGTNTNVNNNGNNNAATSSISDLLNGDPNAIAATVGTIASVVLVVAAANGALPGGVSTVGEIELLPGLTLNKITPYIGTVLQFTGNDDLAKSWASLEPMLGSSQGTAAGVGGAKYTFYNDGIGVFNPEQGDIHALIGKIADAWLQQGLDLGPLGLPTTDQYSADNGELRVDFQGGSISYDPETNTVDINVN